MTHTTYLGKTLSKCKPLEFTLSWSKMPTPIPTWWLQRLLLEDAVLKDEVATVITNYITENTETASSSLVEWKAFKVVIRGARMGATVSARATIVKELKRVEERLGPLETKAVLNTPQAQMLQDARVEHVELIERMGVVDHKTYRE
ncbi:hypothetical protein NDU88_002152 [Pleurodeles waltl]|uniref:Uncharacterized protein n=1 Tax=Pleurodeles waltl TaxID=8319 RepID=A0AAV7S9G5_PLEWA|nr:hypothetical protein NDU88_002152 [Pleurodeles waltl]